MIWLKILGNVIGDNIGVKKVKNDDIKDGRKYIGIEYFYKKSANECKCLRKLFQEVINRNMSVVLQDGFNYARKIRKQQRNLLLGMKLINTFIMIGTVCKKQDNTQLQQIKTKKREKMLSPQEK